MALSDFQRALSRLVMSEQFCSAVRTAPESALAEFELTPRDYKRLVLLADERGLRICTMIHRSFRLSMIAGTLPRTCALLGPHKLKEIVHAYWNSEPSRDYYYEREALRFGHYVRSKLARREIHNEYLQEVLNLELALLSLVDVSVEDARDDGTQEPGRRSSFPILDPLCRIVVFRHDPGTLLAALAERQVPAEVPVGLYYLLLDRASSDEVRIKQVDPWLGGLLSACDGQISLSSLRARFSLTAQQVERLVHSGYIRFRTDENLGESEGDVPGPTSTTNPRGEPLHASP